MTIKLGYDNYQDAKTKLTGTFCLWDGKAFHLKELTEIEPDSNKYVVSGIYMTSGRGTGLLDIDDPKFNCSHYNIGYVNRHIAAGWFYRIPHKQYSQGLRSNQIGFRCSRPSEYLVEFKPGKQLGAMLENNYPTVTAATKLLKSEDANIVAFHRNFAMTWDRLHDDLVFEYKGTLIGFSHDLEEFKLMKEHEHLFESLKEAIAENA